MGFFKFKLSFSISSSFLQLRTLCSRHFALTMQSVHCRRPDVDSVIKFGLRGTLFHSIADGWLEFWRRKKIKWKYVIFFFSTTVKQLYRYFVVYRIFIVDRAELVIFKCCTRNRINFPRATIVRFQCEPFLLQSTWTARYSGLHFRRAIFAHGERHKKNPLNCSQCILCPQRMWQIRSSSSRRWMAMASAVWRQQVNARSVNAGGCQGFEYTRKAHASTLHVLKKWKTQIKLEK